MSHVSIGEREWETTCGICGFVGKGNGRKPKACPACQSQW